MVTFDLVFEQYIKSLLQNVLIPYGHTFYYLNNFKPESIDKEIDRNKYLVIYDEGGLSRIHPDFSESGTKAFFISFITPVIEGGNTIKTYKEQLDDLADLLRFEDVELQDNDGNPLFNVTTVVGDAEPIENVTQQGIRYLFQMEISAVYQNIQDEDKLVAIREEQRKVSISLDGGITYEQVKGKIEFKKDMSKDLNIYPVNKQDIAQNYLKQKRCTLTLQCQRAQNGVVEELYQLCEDNEDGVIYMKIKDYANDKERTYICKVSQASDMGSYGLYNTLLLVFEASKLE